MCFENYIGLKSSRLKIIRFATKAIRIQADTIEISHSRFPQGNKPAYP